MNVSVVGSGYVGTTLAACLAEMGHDVTAIDVDQDVVDSLNAGKVPFHEPGLDELVARHSGDRLRATSSYDVIPDGALTFLAVGTPSRTDGSIDTAILEAAAEMTGSALADTATNHLVVVKSTVTPPALDAVRETLFTAAGTSGPIADSKISLAVNPEFLREGSAVEDFQSPDRLVFGTDSDWARSRLEELYAPLIDRTTVPVVHTDPETAMMIKYAANAFLASKISLVNDIGNLCKEFGLDAYEVFDAVGLDDRISERFLRSGVGWGGSCFPKDLAALIAAGRDQGYDPIVLEAAVERNELQPDRMIDLLQRHVDVNGKRVAVLGLSFKPGTDDIRHSRAIPIIERLRELDAEVVAYDPVATDSMRDVFPDITYADSAASALRNASGVLVVTDWDEFETLREEFATMAEPVVIDGRRCIAHRDGIVYEGLTW